MSIEAILSQKSRDVITCEKGYPVLECIKKMNQNKIGALVVIDSSGKIDGIVTERDILKVIDDRNGEVGHISVSEIMTPKEKLILTGNDEAIETLMDLMTTNRIRHIPIIENENLVGLISIGDVVKSLLDKALVENESMKSYISGM